MAWGTPFNGETPLPLMAEPLQRKKTSEQSFWEATLFSHSKGCFQFGHIVMGYLPSEKNMTIFQKWSRCNGLPAQWKNTRIFQKWSHCNGSPAQWKNTRIFRLVTL
jgi:hypothetical protein